MEVCNEHTKSRSSDPDSKPDQALATLNQMRMLTCPPTYLLDPRKRMDGAIGQRPVRNSPRLLGRLGRT